MQRWKFFGNAALTRAVREAGPAITYVGTPAQVSPAFLSGVPRSRDRLFYTGMAVAAAATVFIGFSRTYFLRFQFQPTSLPTYLRVHGAVFSLWMLLFVVQTSLVAGGRRDFHRRLGWVGAALAAAMVVVAVTAAIISGRRDIANGFEREALTFLTTPLSSMAVFLVLVGSAIACRRQLETHKRLMLLATISILDAATARWPIAIVAGSSLGYYGAVDLFIVSAIVYDIASSHRVHAVYVWGGLLIVASQLLREVLGRTEAWHAIARMILE
jgi:hypothetical protein